MPYNLLILDIDGTLVDSVHLHREALRRSIERATLSFRETKWALYRDRTDSGIYAEAYERSFHRMPTSDECREFERLFELQFRAVCEEPLQPVAGAAALIESASAVPEWRVVFATGSFRSPALHKLAVIGCNHPSMVTSSEHRSRRDIVANAVALGWSGVPRRDRGLVVSVGDGAWDAETARDLGLPFIGIAREGNEEELRRLGAFAVLPDCQGVLRVLSKLLDRREVASAVPLQRDSQEQGACRLGRSNESCQPRQRTLVRSTG